jgi:glycosyltransferase involved in cell wall biosynthesis
MKKFKILIPVYNDWQSLSKLLNNIDNEIENINHEISVIVVDDASTFDRQLEIENLSNINSIKILIMRGK